MEIETQQQEEIRRKFLLGNLTEAERAAVEDAFLADEEKFVQLEIAEDELIEDYLRGDLSGAEKSLFESQFLRTAERRDRVERMKILIDEATARNSRTTTKPEKVSFGEKLAAFFKKPIWQLSFAASFLILFAAFGWWIFNRQSAFEPEIARIEPRVSPTATVSSPEVKVPTNSNLANEIKTNVVPKPSVSPEIKSTPPVEQRPTSLAVFVLQPGGIRGGARENLVRVSAQTGEIGLRLNLETNNYLFYTARVTTVDGATVYASSRLKSNRKSVLLQLPIRKLRRGDYIVELSGVNAAGETESVDDYVFTLEK